MTVIVPSLDSLPSFRDALRRGWWFDKTQPKDACEALVQVDEAPRGFLARFHCIQRSGGMNSIARWIWDGEFCGWIDLRWCPGTPSLPATCLGHIGYNVVPWKQRRRYATQALAQMLPEAQLHGLPYVELVTTPENIASQRVIVTNGGNFVERFEKPWERGGGPALRYRIDLSRTEARGSVES